MPPADFHFSGLGAIVLTAAAVSYALGFAVWRMLRAWQVIDRPNERSSHTEATPRGGGLAILAVWLIGAGVLAGRTSSGLSWLALGMGGMLALVSFVDDRRPLPWWVRLGVQLLVAGVASLSLAGDSPVWWLGLLAILLAGYANAFNFMDGVNGLAAGQAVCSAAGMALIAVVAGLPPTHPAVILSALLAGGAAGFLPHNFPRARMFMGDVGSVPLGFLLMFLTAWLARDGGAWLWLPLGALHAGFVLDTSITMLRRVLRGEKVHEAHREHFYQRLVRAGWSHPAVTGVQMMLSMGVLAMWLAVVMTGRSLSLLAITVTVLAWAVYFAFCEWAFTRRSR